MIVTSTVHKAASADLCLLFTKILSEGVQCSDDPSLKAHLLNTICDYFTKSARC